MCKLALLAALIAATVPGDSPDDASVVPEATTDPRYQCWSSWRLDPDAELVIMETDIAGAEYAAPDTDPVVAGSFTGVGWTFGNLFDDLEDTGYPFGPGDYSSVELNPLTDLDGQMSFPVSSTSPRARTGRPSGAWRGGDSSPPPS